MAIGEIPKARWKLSAKVERLIAAVCARDSTVWGSPTLHDPCEDPGETLVLESRQPGHGAVSALAKMSQEQNDALAHQGRGERLTPRTRLPLLGEEILEEPPGARRVRQIL